jgi:hypothetical protein
MSEKRLKRLLMSPEFAMMMLKGVERPYTTDLPADAKLIEMRIEPSAVYHLGIASQSILSFLLTSESFDELKDGELIPDLNITCHVIENAK